MDPFALYRSFLPTSPTTVGALPYALASGNVYGNLLQQLQMLVNPQQDLLSAGLNNNNNNGFSLDSLFKPKKSEEDDAATPAVDFLEILKPFKKNDIEKDDPSMEENDDSIDIDHKPYTSQDKPEDGSFSPELKPLRSRSFLTDSQVGILTTHFKRNPFPSKYDLSALAEQIGVNKRVVQNMRAKERRSNRLSAISDRLSRNAWKNNNNNTNTINNNNNNNISNNNEILTTNMIENSTTSTAPSCSPTVKTGVNDATLQIINAWNQAIKVRD
uniref:Homeobox domain-containing protein n=1 Tax=Panagrolaimus sp. ES5 TaxID=591445 RepID=A0AC34GQP9_9BILA